MSQALRQVISKVTHDVGASPEQTCVGLCPKPVASRRLSHSDSASQILNLVAVKQVAAICKVLKRVSRQSCQVLSRIDRSTWSI